MDGTNININIDCSSRRLFLPEDVFPALAGTRLLAVFTFGGTKRICELLTVLRFPRPLMTIGFVDDDAMPPALEGISIFIGLLRYGELSPTFGKLAADVVALLFSAKAAAVSRSLPPPDRRYL